jgi:hypothetical protein
MNTNELQGPALDWAVALIEHPEWKEQGFLEVFPHDLSFEDGASHITYTPSTDWAQGGPIIEREFICVSAPMHPSTAPWFAISDSTGCKSSGPTPLIAAMRCYVASKLGDEVEIPEELK